MRMKANEQFLRPSRRRPRAMSARAIPATDDPPHIGIPGCGRGQIVAIHVQCDSGTEQLQRELLDVVPEISGAITHGGDWHAAAPPIGTTKSQMDASCGSLAF